MAINLHANIDDFLEGSISTKSGGKVNDVKVKENVSSDFVSVLNETDKTAYIDLSNKANTTDVENALETKQDTLKAGENITIENGIISASGGGGLDLPTDGTAIAIGTFGDRTIYMQYIDVFVGGSPTYDVWIGQNADIVLGYKVYIMSPANKGSLISIPFSDNALDCSFITNIWTVDPTIKVSINIKQNWLNDARCRGIIIFAR